MRFLSCLLILFLVSSIAVATDPCGGPYSDMAVPTGNIKAKIGTSDHWVTPIGGTSEWEAINFGDKDCLGGGCSADEIPDPGGFLWTANFTSFSGGTLGKKSTMIAGDDPHTSIGVYLQLDDLGNIIDDGGFGTLPGDAVASQNLDIVIPDQETYNPASNPGCAAMNPGNPYGCYLTYKVKVDRNGYTLDFDHCTISETSTWPGFTQHGCNGPVPGIGGSTGLTNNTSNGTDNVSWCHPDDDTDFPAGGCTDQWSLQWFIKSSVAGTDYNYHTPTYTQSVPAAPNNKWSQMTCSRTNLP